MMTAHTEFVRMAIWGMKREHFTEEERRILTRHICGQVVCPRGVIVAVNEHTTPLLDRLRKESEDA